ncbi:efflux RND transporter periplasmic adaptor subunit [Acinetobacter qingfengensis]|uniref:Efflux transporter periplasmic adaptor subunit n=1 Tax=Acinetobacter qingfengensis TaxID=1262585 RepID=A0A1E7RCB4_9GAMM|nr:efflux RND transporter periplasmic adaptor subunit [Acinetobacter qingfengensis]KAA8735253.1 efflux RND transporter periplasmic adaptor subunit [Acinetobacter qingfengensis]OEY96971.1 efflux transporter periplasmic adaptor subunit [Acinetobacter qingfengensis]
MTTQQKKTQWLWVALVAIVVAILAAWIISSKDSASATESEHGHVEGEAEHAKDESHSEAGHGEDGELEFSAKQLAEFGVKLANTEMGAVQQSTNFPAKLIANTDQQAHVSSTFAGRVDSVSVALGQPVKKGQALATLFIPDLVDQQANLSIAQENLTLAQQDYQREKQLFDQGISARQDYQRTYNAYRQAQIQVQTAKSRLNALGASNGSNGRYTLIAPLSGVISRKDIVVGEQVSSDKQLFVIDQLDALWLEFTLPNDAQVNVVPNQEIAFKSLQTQNTFKAVVQALSSEADAQTGRLLVRAKVITPAQELRPNLMVNVELNSGTSASVLRVLKQAIQEIDGKQVVFVAKQEKDKIHITPTSVTLGNYSADGQWVEIKSGLSTNQSYISQGSFLIKSELEKGEAEHGH